MCGIRGYCHVRNSESFHLADLFSDPGSAPGTTLLSTICSSDLPPLYQARHGRRCVQISVRSPHGRAPATYRTHLVWGRLTKVSGFFCSLKRDMDRSISSISSRSRVKDVPYRDFCIGFAGAPKPSPKGASASASQCRKRAELHQRLLAKRQAR